MFLRYDNSITSNDMKRFILSVCLALFAAFNAMAQEAASPNGNVKVKFALNNSVPTYTITFFRGKPVIKPSRLGLRW